MAQVVSKVVSKEGVVGRKPDFTGEGVAVWVNTDKNNKEYLAVKILGQITVNAFAPKANDTKEVQPEKAATPNKSSFVFQCARCNKKVSEMFAFGADGDTCICKDCWHNNTTPVEEDEEETDKYSLSIDEGVIVQQEINEVNE